jgi:hypothetical protein
MEFQAGEEAGYRAITHQKFVGTGYFDQIAQTIADGRSSTTALAGSTEAEQFTKPAVAARAATASGTVQAPNTPRPETSLPS